MVELLKEETSQESSLGVSAGPGVFYISTDNHL